MGLRQQRAGLALQLWQDVAFSEVNQNNTRAKRKRSERTTRINAQKRHNDRIFINKAVVSVQLFLLISHI